MTQIHNPALRGFHPDPSVCCVGENIYVATSTFEWFPGVRLHQTRNLVDWQTLPYPLTRPSQLNLTGNPSSGGIWAPALSYADGLFYLVYTDVKTWKGRYQCPAHDNHNYLVTATDIEGPWSEPIYLNSSGFDPSLFHNEDGSKWLVNMEWDYRAMPADDDANAARPEFARYFGGILLQEYDADKQRLVGETHKIFKGSALGFTEGPHLYRWRDKYYLLTAEGGTSYEHAVTLARSESLLGPYELHPHNPLLSSDGAPQLPLQKAGHGSICQTADGNWLLFHLCGRPLSEKGACPLGRETAVQPLEWKEDDWLYLVGGGNRPLQSFHLGSGAGVGAKESAAAPKYIKRHADFNAPALEHDFQSLRIPITEDWCSLKERPGFLRLYGQEGFSSQFRQSIIARRQQHFSYKAQCRLLCSPLYFQQMAGLIARYDEENQFYLRISHDEKLGRVLGLLLFQKGKFSMPLGRDGEISLPQQGKIWLQVICAYDQLQFYYCAQETPDAAEPPWQKIGKSLPASILSDECAYPMGFTGAFVGMACHDMSGRGMPADFDYFSYEEGEFSLTAGR